MNGDEEIEALRRAFTAPGGTAPRPEDCPSPETLWAAVHGELSPGRLREVVDHTATCPACAEDWRLAVEFEREAAGAPAVTPPLPFPRRRAGLFPSLTAVAAIVLAVVGLKIAWHPNPPVLRGARPVVSRLAEDQPLPRGHCLLVWSGPAHATYSVEVRTLAGERVALASGLVATQYLVPAASLAALPPGTRLEWQVTATLPGEAARPSPTFKFVLR